MKRNMYVCMCMNKNAYTYNVCMKLDGSRPSHSQHANLLKQLVVLLSNGEQVALNALEVVHGDPRGLLREDDGLRLNDTYIHHAYIHI